MKKALLLLCFVSVFALLSCNDNDEQFDYYQVARPLTMSLAEFKANAVDVTTPIEITQSGKIYAYQNYIFINDVNKGIHVIDNSDPNLPQNVAFIKIDGNNDVSIKNNRLFADSYGDLVVFDISNVANIQLSNRLENAIYENYGYWVEGVETPQADFYETSQYDYQNEVITGWQVATERRLVSEFEERYTLYENDAFSNGAPQAPTSGQGGSLARFKIVDDYLYVVDYSDLNVFDISNLDAPQTLDDVNIGWDIETIFNQGDALFIGGQRGMYIYDITSPATPTLLSEFQHGTACDPVVVDGEFAYVTLRGGNLCGSIESGLYVINVADLTSPELEVIYPMVEPYGLGVKNDFLFVSDGSAGLKVYDKSQAPNLTLLNHFEDIQVFDVIPLPGTLLMIGDKVLYQYKYVEDSIEHISTFVLD